MRIAMIILTASASAWLAVVLVAFNT